jgi:hypothetical protein
VKRVATLILNRNLPEVTDALAENVIKYNDALSDVFVVEAGSDSRKLSKYCTWYADWPEAMEKGLRYSKGMNYGLARLKENGEFGNYDAFFLLTNDTELSKAPSIETLINVLDKHPRVGILSPCSNRWGEKFLLEHVSTKYFWFIHNNAYFLRREFVETICNTDDDPAYMNFLFDGTNFRGYGSENELIAKAYANEWAAAITREVWVEENESHLINHADIIKTESYAENLKLYIEEGRRWMKKKYGFTSRWSMQQYVKSFYDKFFELYPEYGQYQI